MGLDLSFTGWWRMMEDWVTQVVDTLCRCCNRTWSVPESSQNVMPYQRTLLLMSDHDTTHYHAPPPHQRHHR